MVVTGGALTGGVAGVGLPATLAEVRERAREVLPAAAWGYHSGGAGDEVMLQESSTAWRRWAPRPRVLVDVTAVDLSVLVLGEVAP